MDPITLIVTALAAGAAAGAQETASTVVKDAYTGLKTLIQQKFKGKPTAEIALTEHEKKPEVWKAPLEEGLKETSVDQDKEVIEAAQKVMSLLQPQQAAMGKYNVQITGNVQGFAQGDQQQVNMHFGQEPKEK